MGHPEGIQRGIQVGQGQVDEYGRSPQIVGAGHAAPQQW